MQINFLGYEYKTLNFPQCTSRSICWDMSIQHKKSQSGYRDISIQYKSSLKGYWDLSGSIWIWLSNTKTPIKFQKNFPGKETNSHFVIPIFFATHVFKTTKSINLSFNLQRSSHPIENICGLYNLNLWQKLNSFHIIFQTLICLNSEFKILKVYNITL